MSKHTPGPWEVIQQDHAIVVRTESPTKTRFGASRYAAVGGFERSDPEQLAEALANASLIAAAPELLSALRMWIDIQDTPAGFAGKYGKALDAAIAAQQLRIDAAVSASRAAIAKAAGGIHG